MDVEQISNYEYTGAAITPEPVVSYQGKILTPGVHYSLTYSNNVDVGTGTITITGMGRYTGSKDVTFEIFKYISVNDLTIEEISPQEYTGSAITPEIVVAYQGKTLQQGVDYIVTYSNNTNVGTATITVTGKNIYVGTLTKTFTIVESVNDDKSTDKDTATSSSVKVSTVKSLKQKASYAKKYIELSWSKVDGADGYEVYRANSKNGKYKNVKTISKTSFKNTGLKAGKNYYYKVRAYKVVDGNKVYGEFSSVKKMITKTNAPSIKVKKTTKTKAKITWKKVTGAAGYEVYMKTGAKGKYKKVKTLSAKKVTYTKNKLKSGTKYYFKVRAYRKVGGKKVYSAWSKTRLVKM